MFFSRFSLPKHVFLFFLVYALGLLFFPIGQVASFEIASSMLVANAEVKKNTPIFFSENNTVKITEEKSKISTAKTNETLLPENIAQTQSSSEKQEKKTLKLWSIHKTSGETSPPVTVSTTNSTLSLIKKAQQHAKLFPTTNSTGLPGLNATIPVHSPSSTMPQIAPVTSW